MQIRRAVDGHAPEVARMVNELILELGGQPLDTGPAQDVARRLVEQPDSGFAVVATLDGRAVGVCTVSYQSSVRTLGAYAIVQEMFVSPEHRGEQMGAKLLRSALETAAEHGCKVVELGTPPNGERQARFYEREGFRAVGARLRRVV